MAVAIPDSYLDSRLLVKSSVKSQFTAPTSSIDMTEWLFNLDEHEYIACTPQSHAHLTAGLTHSADGKRMSINVEDVGGALIIQHYVAAIGERLHCRVVSTSDLLIGRDFTTAQITWDLLATPIGGDRHEFVNSVWIHSTDRFDAYMVAHHIPAEGARHEFQAALDAHNAEETPHFALAIEKHALKRSASK